MKKLSRKELDVIVGCCKKAIKEGQLTIEVAPEDLLGIIQNLNSERFRLTSLNKKYSMLTQKYKTLDHENQSKTE